MESERGLFRKSNTQTCFYSPLILFLSDYFSDTALLFTHTSTACLSIDQSTVWCNTCPESPVILTHYTWGGLRPGVSVLPGVWKIRVLIFIMWVTCVSASRKTHSIFCNHTEHDLWSTYGHTEWLCEWLQLYNQLEPAGLAPATVTRLNITEINITASDGLIVQVWSSAV